MDRDALDRQGRESALHEPPAGSSITYRVDHDRGTVFVTASGDVTIEALRAANSALRTDPKFSIGMDIYVECRVLTGLPTADELRSIALTSIFHQAEARHGRIAIVATTARSYEAASTFEFFSESAPDRMAVFTDPAAALAWLGIDGIG